MIASVVHKAFLANENLFSQCTCTLSMLLFVYNTCVSSYPISASTSGGVLFPQSLFNSSGVTRPSAASAVGNILLSFSERERENLVSVVRSIPPPPPLFLSLIQLGVAARRCLHDLASLLLSLLMMLFVSLSLLILFACVCVSLPTTTERPQPRRRRRHATNNTTHTRGLSFLHSCVLSLSPSPLHSPPPTFSNSSGEERRRRERERRRKCVV